MTRAGDDVGRVASRGGAALLIGAGDDVGRVASRGGAALLIGAGDDAARSGEEERRS
jgi:hypothetical protein